MDDEKLDIILSSINILAETERTVTDTEFLTAQVKEVRRNGYALTRGERVAGVMCVAAPIPTYYAPVAISVVGPETRIAPHVKTIIAGVKESAHRISLQITRALTRREAGMKARRP